MTSKNLKISQPYAEALLESSNKGSLDTLITDLNNVYSSLSTSKDLEKLLSNPLVNSQTKKNVIKSIFSEKIEATTLRFLLVLCDRVRITYAKSIVEKALELEKKVNDSLLALHKVASNHNDPHLTNYLEGEFLDEQVESIKKFADMITRLKRAGPEGLGEYIF